MKSSQAYCVNSHSSDNKIKEESRAMRRACDMTCVLSSM